MASEAERWMKLAQDLLQKKTLVLLPYFISSDSIWTVLLNVISSVCYRHTVLKNQGIQTVKGKYILVSLF
jgi:hypothetical protein